MAQVRKAIESVIGRIVLEKQVSVTVIGHHDLQEEVLYPVVRALFHLAQLIDLVLRWDNGLQLQLRSMMV